MASKPVIWHGTQEEAFALQHALERNCICEYEEVKEEGSGETKRKRVKTCEPHRMLAEDQTAIDHLLFVRRTLADRMLVEEFDEWR